MSQNHWNFGEQPRATHDIGASIPASARRTGGVTAICVVAIVLGVIGVGISLLTVTMTIFRHQLQQFSQVQNAEAKNSPQLKTQLQIQDSINAVTNRFAWWNICVASVHLLLASWLVVVATKLLGLHEEWRRRFVSTSWTIFVFELIRAISIGFFISQMLRVLSAIDPANQDASSGAYKGIIVISQWGSLIFGLGWAAIKLAAIYFAIAYLRRPSTKAIFSSNS